MRTAWVLLIVVLSAAVRAEVDEGQLIVVESSTQQLIPGDEIGPADHLELSAGEHVLLINRLGVLIRATGPFSGSVDSIEQTESSEAPGGGWMAAIGRIFALEEAEDLGGIRGENLTMVPIRPSPWLLPIGISGEHCVRDEDMRISMYNAGHELVELRISGIGGSEQFSMRVPAGERAVVWPEKAEDGQVYLVRAVGSERSSAIRAVAVPASLPEDYRMVMWLSSQGCAAQAVVLARRLRQAQEAQRAAS